jgi:hypothetical protein
MPCTGSDAGGVDPLLRAVEAVLTDSLCIAHWQPGAGAAGTSPSRLAAMRHLPPGSATGDPSNAQNASVNDPPPPALPAGPDAFASRADRVLLSPAAMAALCNLARAWRLTQAEAIALAGVSAPTWRRIQIGNWRETLSQEQLLRISVMVDVYLGLHLLFGDAMADRWVRLRNAGPLFAHMSPVGVMVVRGMAGLLEVRRYVDEMRWH